jgi:hypothetical protein
MRRVLPFALGLAILAVPLASEAQRHPFNAGGISIMGGQTLPKGRNAIAAGGFYPSMAWGQFTFGLAQSFDLGLRGDFFYASPLATGPFGYGFGFSVPMRVGISQTNKVGFALKLAPDVIMGDFADYDYGACYSYRGDVICHGDPYWNRRYYNDRYADEFGFGVGFPVSIVNIITGITTPFHIVFLSDADVTGIIFPIAPFGGAEVRLTDDLNVFGMGQFGISIESWSGYRDTDSFFRFWAGIEYAL